MAARASTSSPPPARTGVDRQRPRRWGFPVAVAATSLLAVACYLIGDWRFAAAPPRGDLVQVFLLVEELFRTGELRFDGVPSVLPLNHPGPFLVWLLFVGRTAAAALGVEPQVAMIVAYVAACVALVAVSAVAVAKACANRAAAAALVVVYLALQVAWVRDLPPWAMGSGYWDKAGLIMFPITPPLIGTHLTMASLAAVLAIGRWRAAPYLCVLLGGWNFQVFVEHAPAGFAVGLVGCVALVLAASRASSGRLGIALGATLCWLVGFGPFLLRMFDEGFDLPWRYVTAAHEAKTAIGGSNYDADWLGRLADAWHTGRWTVVVLAAAVVVLVTALVRPTWRNLGYRALATMPFVVFYLAYASTSFVYQTSLLAAPLPLIFAAPLGRVLGRLRPTVLAVGTAAATAAVLVPITSQFQVPLVAIYAQQGPEAIRQAVTVHADDGDRVVLLVDAAVLATDSAAREAILALDYQLYRTGLRPCSPPPVSAISENRGGAVVSPDCVIEDAAVVVHIARTANASQDVPVLDPSVATVDGLDTVEFVCGNEQVCLATVAAADAADPSLVEPFYARDPSVAPPTMRGP